MKPAELWETGCKSDVHRNEFVIPMLIEWAAHTPFERLIYLGSGTGYVIRSVIEKGVPGEYTLIDSDPEKIRLSQSLMPANANARHVCCDIFDLPAEVGAFDAVLICNLLLEVELTSKVVSLIRNLIVPGGIMYVFLPDTLVDFLNSNLSTGNFSDYVMDKVSLEKTDKFTRASYPFIAQRFLHIVGRFCREGFNLIWVERSPRIDGYCLLVFRKDASFDGK